MSAKSQLAMSIGLGEMIFLHRNFLGLTFCFNPLSFQGFFGVNFRHNIFFLMHHGTLVFSRKGFWFVAFLRRKADF